MASNFTVIQFQRQHFGNQPGTFNDLEPNVPFVGPTKDFSFDCPNVAPGETAFLMFQSRDVDHQRNGFQINGIDIFGGLPASPSRDTWNGNILLIEPQHQLQETDNVLRVESRNSTGGSGGDIDDFIIDNVVIEYKARAVPISLFDFAPLTGTDWTASMKEAIAYLKARYGGGVLVVPGGTYNISDTITISQVRGLEIRGEGSITTDFEWAGVPTLPMFTFNRTQGCYLENVSITAKPSFPLLEGVRIQQGANDATDHTTLGFRLR